MESTVSQVPKSLVASAALSMSTVTMEAMAVVAVVAAHHLSLAVPEATVVSTAMPQPLFVVTGSQRFRARVVRDNGVVAAAVRVRPVRQMREDSTVDRAETAKS